MGIKTESFGKTDSGQAVTAYVLENGGIKARVINYGATLVSVEAPDADGQLADLVLGFDTIEGYQGSGNPYFGATCGRFANRIKAGKFSLDGSEYSLAINNGPNALHGGLVGFDKKVWESEIVGETVKMSLVSCDGEEGYPGELTVKLTFSLNDEGELRLDYEAMTDQKTVLNLTNHSYFNLAGHASGPVHDQIIRLNADHYTEVDDTSIPTGNILPVSGTEMDLTIPTPIGKRIAEVQGGGYDHNYCIKQLESGALTLAATVRDPKSGRLLECWTTEPGVQFYTGNFLDGVAGKSGAAYEAQGGFCLETQHYPDSPNHPEFPSTELEAGEVYTQTCIYKFGLA